MPNNIVPAPGNLNAELAIGANNPPNAPAPNTTDATAPDIQTQPDQAQPPSLGQQQQPAAPAAPPDPHREHGKLFQSVMDVLGGKDTTYNVDPKTGKLQANSVPLPAGTWAQRLIAGAFSGLAAGSASVQPRDVNPWARSLSAGYVEQKQLQQQKDAEKRKQAAEDFEREQKLTLTQHDIARSNALMLATHLSNIKAQNDLDPGRSSNKSMAQDLQDAGVNVRFMNEKEAEAARAADPKFAVNHLILPIGHTVQTDSDGNAIQDQLGNVQRVGNVAVIDGLHDGKVPIPSALADDIQKYGKAAGISNYDTLKAGDEYDMRDLVRINHALMEAKSKVAAGWVKPETVYVNGQPMQYNSAAPDGENLRPIPGKLQSPEAEAASAATTAERKAQTNKANAEAAKAKAETPSTGAAANGVSGEDYLKTLPATDASSVRAIGEGRAVMPTRATKEGVRLMGLVTTAYPDWDQSKGTTWAKTRNEYMGSGATAKAVTAANTALEHMQRMFDHTTASGVYNPVSSDHQRLQTDITFVTGELGKAVKGGVIAQGEAEKIEKSISGGLTPGLRRDRIKEATQILHDRIDQTQQKFNDAAPSAAVKVPVLMGAKAGRAYDYINSDGKTGGLPQAPAGKVAVQIPGMSVGFIPKEALGKFKADHPNAVISEE